MEAPDDRVSDIERDRVRAILQQHAADGRLTLDELSDRLDGTYAATTRRQLEDALRDLPPPAPAGELFDRIEALGSRYHRGALSRREFAAKKADLLAHLGAIRPDEVGVALDGLTRLRHRGMLTMAEFRLAKSKILPLA